MNTHLFIQCVLVTILWVSVSQGYIIARLTNQPDFNDYNNNDRSTIRRIRSSTEKSNQDDLISDGSPSYSKKSPVYNNLKKFTGSASRNCFFTPIQCMIQQDVNKYRKLVDTNTKLGGLAGVNKRRFLFDFVQ